MVDDVIEKKYDVINFFHNIFILQKPGLAIFADIMKTITIIFKTTFKDSIKVKRIRNYVSK